MNEKPVSNGETAFDAALRLLIKPAVREADFGRIPCES